MEASALRRQRAAVLPRSRRLLTALSDDRLVEQVRRGNAVAFEVIFDRHYRGILSFCRHMVGSLEEAEDAVQQTFTSAYTDLQSNRREIRLKAWLYTIARNRCLSILRARREQATDLTDEDLPTAGLTEQVQHRADLQELLHDMRELPDDQREALVLFEIGDLSQAEVANVIGVEPVKVKALVYQARSALIENREARAIPCAEIREQLATASGGALRRGPLRRHLKACEGCREYRDQVKTQRRALAALLPVVPTAGFKSSVLAAIGFGGGGAGGGGIAAGGGVATGAAGATSGTAAGGTGLLASIGGVGAAKLVVAAALGTGALIGGGVAVERAVTHDSDSTESAQAAEAKGGQGGAGTSAGGPKGASATPVVNGGASERRSGEGKKDQRGSKDDDAKDNKGDDASGGKSDDAKDHKGESKGHGHRNGSRHGSSSGHGSPGNSSNTPGGSRGNSSQTPAATHSNSGNTPGGTRGNSGSTPAAGNPPSHPQPSDGNKGSRNSATTPVVPPPAEDGQKKGGKAGDVERILAPVVALPLPQ